MNSFCCQNLNQISGGGALMNVLKFNGKIHDNNAKWKKVLNVMDGHGAWGNMEARWMGPKHSS
jgi:hypothetical protein